MWIGGLDRLHRSRGILTCYDFSATPFTPSGKKSSEEALFGWIVNDFGLNDAIESGLVKTPRVVVRDDAVPDARTYKSRLYHIYNDPDVKDDLNRRASPEEPLPDLVLNAYYLLGYDWREAWKEWQAAGLPTPPVMITVANRTETAARVKHAFDSKRIHIDELCDPERVLHIDSKVLDEAEAQEDSLTPALSQGEREPEQDDADEDGPVERKLTKAEQAELLRQTVDTVGKPGLPGEKIQKVISVGMLSEGWDAKTVTHIMGLRAFSSQLLCEQVVGRGLRRVRVKGVEPTEPQICAVVDHPKLEHQWLWDIFNARKRTGVLIDQEFDETEDLPPPPPKQELVKPELVIDVPPVDLSVMDEGEFDVGDIAPPPKPLEN